MTYIRAIREVCRIFTLFAYIFHAWNSSVFMSVLFFSNFVTHGFGAKTLKILWVVRANVTIQHKYNLTMAQFLYGLGSTILTIKPHFHFPDPE